MSEKYRDFKATTASLKNRNTIYLLIFILAVAGVGTYKALPKEMFPEVALPMIMVQTVYPGNPPLDIENMVTRPLEKEIFTVDGIKKMSSTSSQDNSIIRVEFTSGTNIKTALQDMKDAVDRADSELPDDLPIDPLVIDIDPSEFPVININLSGDFEKDELKKYAEYLEEKIEEVYEVSKVNIKGVEDKLIRIHLDKQKMDASNLSFGDVEGAISAENVAISGGDIILSGTRRSVRTSGEFTSLEQLNDIIVKSDKGNIVYLKDVVKDGKIINGYKDVQSLARLDGKNVVSLQVIKKGGENLIRTSEQIMEILDNAKKDILPEGLSVSITNDQSDRVRKMILNLENNIIMGVIFVMFVLFFFLGTRNAMLVGFAIPMSMFISFVILGAIDATINMIVLFSLILALGMLVDNAIVVVENIHRFIQRGYKPMEAARLATGEIAWAIIASTATTLGAFIPLMFWPGIMGKFMYFLPTTLIIVLSSSLFVALILIPAITLIFKSGSEPKKPQKKRTIILVSSLIGAAILFYIFKMLLPANLLIVVAIITTFNYLVFFDIGLWFQNVFLVRLEGWYLRFLRFALRGKRPGIFLLGTLGLLIFTIVFLQIRQPDVSLFPDNEPQFFLVKTELPVGVDITKTDSIAEIVEKDVVEILKNEDYYKDSLITSVLTTVGKGAVGQSELAFGNTPNKAVTTLNFVDYEFRKGRNTKELMKTISDSLIGKYPGVIISVEKNRMGPPTGKPINIEISGDKFDKLLELSDTIIYVINNENISGIEGLKIDLNLSKPEMNIIIDREAARRFGLSTGQIASTIRTALFGKEVSDYKVGEDKYPIQIQLAPEYRNNISALLNQIITFRNKSGKFVHIPVSAVADYEYTSSYDAVKRIDNKRVITVFSGVLEGSNANAVNAKIKKVLNDFDFPEGYTFEMTGEQQEQQETSAFLMKAMLIAVALILLIMVTQFNSVIKPFIIMATVLFSTIGVFGGIATFKMDFIILMTGVGIISLAGVVVNNGIVLIDYIDYLKKLRKQELGMGDDENLSFDEIVQIIVTGGQTRLRPVLLTAITTILGLIPMAVGFNIDFENMLSDFNPNIYFGGDNADFWGPMAWTVIFGLTFATFLTLVLVPVMYLIGNRIKLKFTKSK